MGRPYYILRQPIDRYIKTSLLRACAAAGNVHDWPIIVENKGMSQPLPAETLILRTDTNALLRHYMTEYLRPEMVLYDVGCGEKPFADFLRGKVKQHIGVDLESGFYSRDKIDLVGSAEALPIGDATADAVLSSQVIEHLRNPLQAIAEAARVLKPGGYLFLSFPFLYPLHALPHDYWRLSENTVRTALTDNGLAVLNIKSTGGFWYIISFYSSLYLGGFNRSVLKPLRIVPAATWLIRMLCRGFHGLESLVARHAGKDIADIRTPWVVNYVFIAQKQHHD